MKTILTYSHLMIDIDSRIMNDMARHQEEILRKSKKLDLMIKFIIKYSPFNLNPPLEIMRKKENFRKLMEDSRY